MYEVIPIFLFAITATLTPGPNNFMIMNSGLCFGIRKSLPHYFGICFGFPAMVLIVALGFGTLFMQYSWLKHVLKFLGCIYILYLAWQIIAANNFSNVKDNHKPCKFFEACMFQWVNPKAWLCVIGAVSIFSLTTGFLSNAVIISLIFLLVCVPCLGIWLVFGTFLQRILKNNTHKKWFNNVMALCLITSLLLI